MAIRSENWCSKPSQPLPKSAYVERVYDWSRLCEPESDVCGHCGKTGAKKRVHKGFWPGEHDPGTPFVHAVCELIESRRAWMELSPSEHEAFVEGL